MAGRASIAGAADATASFDVLIGFFSGFGIFFFHIREQFDSLEIRHMEKLKED